MGRAPATFAAAPRTSIAVGATTLALAAMVVDHLMGDDPGLEDPPMFAIAAVVSVTLAAALFGWWAPRATRALPRTAAKRALACSTLAILPGVAALWVGVPFVLAGAGLAVGLDARRRGAGGLATAAMVLAVVVLAGATVAYVSQAVDKAI